MRRSSRGMGLVALVTLLAFVGGTAGAASHSDAPLIKQDPQANLTDVYAFVGTKYNNPREKVLNVVVHVRPFSEPGDGVMYERFADDARYSIHIADPLSGAELVRYDFKFSNINPQSPPGLKNPNTILSYGNGTAVGPINNVGDARQNFVQTYDVTKVVTKDDKRRRDPTTLVANDLLTPPPNVGARTTPAYNDANGRAVSGATSFAALDRYTRQTVFGLGSGEAVFAGPREDGFFADTPGIFDLLDPRILGGGLGQAGTGVDGFKGFNVLAYAIQIPLHQLPSLPYQSPFFGPQTGVGVYASVSVRASRSGSAIASRSAKGRSCRSIAWAIRCSTRCSSALRDKDNYNRRTPTDDAAFATYARNPELAGLLNTVFGTNFVTMNREDLVAIFIPDVLRVNTGTGPVRLAGQAGFSRLGFIGGDTTGGVSGGWPNGRRLGDDVVDIALTAIASGPSYSTITVVGDNINANDQVYHQVFPYSATPHAGPTNRKDP